MATLYNHTLISVVPIIYQFFGKLSLASYYRLLSR